MVTKVIKEIDEVKVYHETEIENTISRDIQITYMIIRNDFVFIRRN